MFQRNATPRAAAMRASSCVKRCASPDSSLAVKMPPASLLAARRERGLDRDALVDASSRRGRSRTRASARPARTPCANSARVGVERQDAALEVVVLDAGLARAAPAGSRASTARGCRHWIVLRRVRDGRHSSRNCRPQRHCRGSSAQPEQQRRVLAGPATSGSSAARSGLAHGSACDAEIWPPLANDVSSAGARLAVDDRDLVAVLRRGTTRR